jgi:hypothetical protein
MRKEASTTTDECYLIGSVLLELGVDCKLVKIVFRKQSNGGTKFGTHTLLYFKIQDDHFVYNATFAHDDFMPMPLVIEVGCFYDTFLFGYKKSLDKKNYIYIKAIGKTPLELGLQDFTSEALLYENLIWPN